MSNKETKKNTNIITEAYKINLEVDREREIYEELLKKSNNKSGLVKDALVMYLTLIKSGAYTSPFLNTNTSDWDMILRNLSLDRNLGRPAQEVKEEVIAQQVQQQEYQPVQQPRKEELNTSSICEDDEDDDFSMDDDDELDY